MIRVLLVDDHEAVRSSLCELLANYEDIDVVGAVADGETAVVLSGSTRPDVVLMDISMPGIGGIEATRLIAAARPGTQVLVFTAFSDSGHVTDALAAGATGVVSKGVAPNELIDQIRRAAG